MHEHHHHERPAVNYSAAVITVSDKGSRGERVDTSGPAIAAMAEKAGYHVEYTAIVPDEKDRIAAELIACADEKQLALVLTTGGTGFSPRDVTPEATLSVVERETRGIPELMRAESCKITPRGCLSRAAAGIRGKTLIVNLPGSEKAATENLAAVLDSLAHGLDMLYSAGSADCGQPVQKQKKLSPPSADVWLKQAKADPTASRCGMYLTHTGTVRETAKAAVREGAEDTRPVVGMRFSYDAEKVRQAEQNTLALPGIFYVKTWLNNGELSAGDTIMQVLIGGDIRPHVTAALDFLVGTLKEHCISEEEIYEGA